MNPVRLAERLHSLPFRMDGVLAQITPSVLELRRQLHRCPELGFQEVNTATILGEKLEAIGIQEIRRNIAGTGMLATLRGNAPGKTVAIRADLDALPIQEKEGREYGSQRSGKMHACGHDAHMAIAWGTAAVLQQLQSFWSGSVQIIFQPAEEGDPAGGSSGAIRMLKEGLWESAIPDAPYALHVMPTLEVGRIGCNPGAVWAGADLFSLRLQGKRTHGAYPHTGLDPIPIAAQVILGLQTIVSRQVNPHHPTVLTIGEIHGGERHNIIAEEVLMNGTVRTLHPEGSEFVRQRMESFLEGITRANGAGFEWDYHSYAPVMVNHPYLALRAREVLGDLFGSEKIVALDPQLGAEDFAHLARLVPAVYFFLGVGNPSKGIQSMLHTSDFDIDEAALPIGIKAMCALLLDQLAG